MPARRKGGSLLRVALATLAVAGPQTAAALSLGESVVRSSLGQPLRVELGIESDPRAGGLPEARLVNADGTETWIVQGAGLGSVRLEVEAIDDVRQRLRIRSTQPVWEPLITLRIEVTQASMRIVREVPILIDPPAAEAPAPEPAAMPAVAAAAIDTPRLESLRMAPVLSAAAAPAVAEAEAAEPPAPPAPPVKRRQAPQARPAPPEEPAREPLRRFTLTTALSTESLAWLEIHPSPRAAPPSSEPIEVAAKTADSAAETDTVEAEAEPKIQTAAAGVAKALTVVPSASASMLAGQMETRLTTGAPGPVQAAERGLPMGSPWRVFGVMALLAFAVFVYARRMRKWMTRYPPPTAA